jgi:hypothetical protein
LIFKYKKPAVNMERRHINCGLKEAEYLILGAKKEHTNF